MVSISLLRLLTTGTMLVYKFLRLLTTGTMLVMQVLKATYHWYNVGNASF